MLSPRNLKDSVVTLILTMALNPPSPEPQGPRHCSDIAQPRLVDVPVMQVKEEALDWEFPRPCGVWVCEASGF